MNATPPVRRRLSIVGAGLLLASVTGCTFTGNDQGTGSRPTPTNSEVVVEGTIPAPDPSVASGPVEIDVTGSCAVGITFTIHGLTPGEQYSLSVNYPDGSLYDNWAVDPATGTAATYVANPDGTGVRKWVCEAGDPKKGQTVDPEGTYKLKVIDKSDGTSAETTFIVEY